MKQKLALYMMIVMLGVFQAKAKVTIEALLAGVAGIGEQSFSRISLGRYPFICMRSLSAS